ncbi:7-carboxy-7-deazaguanine synthase [Vreelandella lutescens]|uniref:7-carboxy-7-deazaguanine synthase n=1 Tax=Vreelandella lutescens TaxID=1602943 RepID=A0ABQ1PJH2_9GAMM|nr:7-carboxy-7-deazaguanine synthase [Halomonas lutescens]GGC98111.1 7-carboxy-7-deazaguanine synthase [Halomonas lutescens]
MYHVKEAFYTLQGEGAQAGRASVFCRFTGCNLWSGREADRASAKCTFCDTDFIGTDGINGGRFATAQALANHIKALWPHKAQHAVPYVVFTGGEPLLQLDTALIAMLHSEGFEVAVETNGTVPAPAGIDWLCVSPKSSNPLVITHGDELKLVFPQADAPPEQFANLAFSHFFLQPMDRSAIAPSSIASDSESTVKAATAYCMANPQWRLSLQTHKIAGFE